MPRHDKLTTSRPWGPDLGILDILRFERKVRIQIGAQKSGFTGAQNADAVGVHSLTSLSNN